VNYIIFGGSGFIGTHLIHLLKEEYIKPNDKIYDLDLVMPGEEGVVPGIVEHNDGVQYMRMDVRKLIHFDIPTTPDDIVFNLAAVHRTPGHEDNEYFETNIRGAEDVTKWCEEKGIKRILFTSSIAPYGASEEIKYETTLPTPNTPYGISKLVAEKIHEKWATKEDDRQLIICRPGIVYGKGEHGNMTRLYAGLKGHYFVYTGRKDTIKACIYVKELVHFMMWALNTGKNGIYNCTFEPAFTIEQIVQAVESATGLKTWVPLIPGKLLMVVAKVVGPLGGKAVGIHPARVKKLMISTNICGKKLKNSGYKRRWGLEDSFKDWFEDCNRECLK